MHEPWFYCPELRPGAVTLDETESHHAFHSLRLRAGATLTLFDGRGQVARATVAELAESEPTESQRPARRKQAAVQQVLVREIDVVPQPACALTLIVAACKGPRLDTLVEKTTELGVQRLHLAKFERSVVLPGVGHVKKLRRVAVAACKQSRRAWLPQIFGGETLERVIVAAGEQALLVAKPADEAQPMGAWLAGRENAAAGLAVVIGPEGGLAPAEQELLRAAGAVPIRLGPNVLRVETAAIAVAACWAGALA